MYTNYKTYNYIILQYYQLNNVSFHVWAEHNHLLQASVKCISARQSYLCYIFYEFADNDLKLAYKNKPISPTLNMQ